jgi:hypothetical protein
MKRELSPKQRETLERNAFKPGQSGNPGGQSPMRLLTSALRELLSRTYPGDPEGRTWAERIALSVAEKAVAGDTAAAKLIGERVEGLPQIAVKIGPHPDFGDYHISFKGQLRRIGDLSNDEMDELYNEASAVIKANKVQ